MKEFQKFDLLQKIKDYDSKFTNAERKVAGYVIQNADRIVHLTISELAALCNVADTTVFRFCHTLELSGYTEFRMQIAQSMHTESHKLFGYSEELNMDDNVETTCRKIMSINMKALVDTFKVINYQVLEQAIEMIRNANKIAFFGIGSSSITAMDAYTKFLRICPNAEYVQDSHFQVMLASQLKEQDLAIGFSVSGTTKDIISIFKTAKLAGCKTVCITRNENSPISVYSDVILRSIENEGPFEGGALSAKLSQILVIDFIYALYYKKCYPQSMENKILSSKAIADKLL